MQQELGTDPELLTPTQALVDLGIDSLSMIEFMFSLETEFGCELPPNYENLKTIGDLVQTIDTAVAAVK
jgi:acyl carrier protein